MDDAASTMAIEDRHMPPFAARLPIAIERGEGVYVWDENGRRYLDFTAGWGVTCLGHAAPPVYAALVEQGKKILQNPNSGLTYSPVRARLLSRLVPLLPPPLTRVFFCNSGAEANDAAIKLARKVTARTDVISTLQSFHGRTIGTASATGQPKHRDRYQPRMPNFRFIPYDDPAALAEALDGDVAAVIVEPIQGEGGVNVPSEGCLEEMSVLCHENGSLLIVDEIQTGFCRTGPLFAISGHDVEPDFLTMGKGIAGGFPFAAFALTEGVAARLGRGDHGGTYCGNPLGCAVAHAVLNELLEKDIPRNVEAMGSVILDRMRRWHAEDPDRIRGVRGRGLLAAMELADPGAAERLLQECLHRGLIVNLIQDRIVRLSPALNITRREVEEGLAILEGALEAIESA
ncbi:MAG: aspartate aminotransferase family protein [Methanomicrobiales archaeon]|nr:aspartate aminotransferase family protein [Methanomicrobiales archaeon]